MLESEIAKMILEFVPIITIIGIMIGVYKSLFQSSSDDNDKQSHHEMNDSIPESILKMRLAKGEITPEKYTELMSRL